MEKFEQKSPATTEKSVEAGPSSVENELPGTLERLMWVSSITLGNVIVLGGAGWLLDGYFHTKPWLLIVGLVLAFVGTQVMIYQKMTQLVKRAKGKN